MRARLGRLARALGLGRSYRGMHLAGWHQAQATPVPEDQRLSPGDILAFLTGAGLVPGDTLWLQSNWNTLGPHKLDPIVLIRDLVEAVGPEGHIMMPAFLDARDKNNRPVDFAMLPTSTGLVTEIWRRWPGVVRSVDLDSSIAKSTLKNCASSEDHYFLAQDGYELEQAFRQVAFRIAQLRLTK